MDKFQKVLFYLLIVGITKGAMKSITLMNIIINNLKVHLDTWLILNKIIYANEVILDIPNITFS